MDRFIRGIFWILGYLLLVSAPLLVLFADRTPAGRGFAADFNVALAFAGTAMMGMMFFLTARSRSVGSSIGIDIIYYFHRRIALAAYGFVLIHVVIALFVNKEFAVEALRNGVPLGMRFGVAALLLLTALVVSSVWRKELCIPYEVWRFWHTLAAISVIVLSLLHIFSVSYYAASPAKVLFWGALALLWAATIVWAHVVKPLLRRSRPYEVVEVRPEAGEAWTIALAPLDHEGMRFKPGQFAWLTLGQSAFTLNEHPFSFSSSALRHDRVEFTIKELGDFTSTVKHIPHGQTAYLDGPHGSFSTDQHDAPEYFFFAGGIGITPIMSILRTLSDRRDKRRLVLLYGSKTLEEMTFRDELQRLSGQLDLAIVEVPELPPDDWEGESGFMDDELINRYLPDYRSGAKYFLCGPGPMKAAVERALHRLRVPLENIYTELFDLV